MLWLPRARANWTPAQLAQAKPKSVGGGGSCPADGSPSAENNGDTFTRTWGGSNLYVGQSNWTDGGTPRTICKLAFELGENATGNDFRSEIWTLVTTINLLALQATSDVVAGANWGTSTWVYFTYATPFLTSASVAYALTVRPVTALGGNDLALYGGNTSFTGFSDTWSSLGVANNGSGNDASIRIYWT